MFERAVTARYLASQPEEVHSFLDFNHIAQHKNVNCHAAKQRRVEHRDISSYSWRILSQEERLKRSALIRVRSL
jgi:hypothetical protein